MKQVVILKSQIDKIGGLEKYAWHSAKAFADKGFRVHLLTSGKKNPLLRYDNVELHYFDRGYGPGFMRIDQFDRYCQYWIDKLSPDIVLGMDRNTKQTHIRAGNGIHRTYLKQRALFEPPIKKLSFLVNPLHKKILDMEKRAFEEESLQKVITNSVMVQQELAKTYSIPKEKIQVVYNGVDCKKSQLHFENWQEEKQTLLDKFQLDPSFYNFLFIGNGYKRKGLKQLLEALSLMPNKSFYLHVIGYDKNIGEYIRYAKKLKLQKQVLFFGKRSDAASFYPLADSLVIPSFYDPFANVTLEAMAMGVSVLSSRFNGGHEILSPLSGSIIEDLLDRDSFSELLSQTIDKRKTKTSSQEIRSLALKYDFSNQLDQLTNAII